MEFAPAWLDLVLNMTRRGNNERAPVNTGPGQFCHPTKWDLTSMARFLMIAFVLFPSCLALAGDPPEFKVTPCAEVMAEGGTANMLAIDTGEQTFELSVPKSFGAQFNTGEQTIVFTSTNGSSVITVRMSTNYAGKLPKMEDLRDQVSQKYPASSLVQTSPCHSSYGTGFLYDLFQPAAGGMTIRIRDGFISFPKGSFEFTLTCDVRDYDQNRLRYAWLLNSFRLQAEPARKDP
jgi:hypothetical protein